MISPNHRHFDPSGGPFAQRFPQLLWNLKNGATDAEETTDEPNPSKLDS